jgi:hypothetical protein
MRDSFGIHPDEQMIVEAKVKHVLSQHRELELMPWKMLERAWEIGAELIELKEKVYQGKWGDFCKESLASMTVRNIERYMQLAKHKDRLLTKYKTDTRVDFDELPPIRQALTDIQTWSREEREAQGKASIRHRSKSKEKRSSRPAYDISVLDRLCPACRAILEALHN